MDVQFYQWNTRSFIDKQELKQVAEVGDTVFLGPHGRWRVLSREQRFEEIAWNDAGYEEVWLLFVEPVE